MRLYQNTPSRENVMIHHGPEVQHRGPRGGVVIILLKTLAEGWKKGEHI
jgi:hypothetical protein